MSNSVHRERVAKFKALAAQHPTKRDLILKAKRVERLKLRLERLRLLIARAKDRKDNTALAGFEAEVKRRASELEYLAANVPAMLAAEPEIAKALK